MSGHTVISRHPVPRPAPLMHLRSPVPMPPAPSIGVRRYTRNIVLLNDVLLEEVGSALATLATLHLPPLFNALNQLPREEARARLVRQLLLLQCRSRDVLQDFAGFYCVRLLLDNQSSLATYFIDLFSQLEWMLEELDTFYGLRLPPLLWALRRSIRPAIHTCRVLYAAYRMLPRSKTSLALNEQRRNQRFYRKEFKREGKHSRMFSGNAFHSRIRTLGFVNLDKQARMVSLREELGAGGIATVFKGVFEADNGNDIIGDPVAVKMFANGNIHNFDSTPNEELIVELQRPVSVRHPNVVTPRGYIGRREQGESGLVMELMDESLHDYLEKVNNGSTAPLQELDILDLMLEIAKGMRFLHECGLVHRDLKPKNVLLRCCTDHVHLGCKLREVKLADFGLTKLCGFSQDGSTTYTHTAFRGTSCYMAPELRFDVCSQESPFLLEKVDVFSYGTTCFNILIGDPDVLTFSQTVKNFYEAVKTGEWKQWVQGIDKHLHFFVKLIARCWEPEPALRPTFATLCVLLQHAMQCLLSARSLRNAMNIAATQEAMFKLHSFNKDCKAQYSHVYKSIMRNYLRHHGAVGGVGAITKCFLDFESTSGRNRFLQMVPCKWLREWISGCSHDVALDISIFLKAMRKGDFNAVKEHAEAPAPFKSSWICDLMDSCLDKPDTLLFIKALACHNLAERYYHNAIGEQDSYQERQNQGWLTQNQGSINIRRI